MLEWLDLLRAWAWSQLIDLVRESPWAVGLVLWAILRATGQVVDTGQTGLLFSFGRARQVLGPGFRLLIPFLQVVRIVPTRHRTLHLPAQRVTTRDGLVYFVDANFVYRVVDIRKALIEIDDLVKGMTQGLGLGVQAVLRQRGRADLRAVRELDLALAEDLGRRLEGWGIEVVRAGFITITPSPESLRVTQVAARTAARKLALESFEAAGLRRDRALALLGTRARLLTRVRGSRERERALRSRKRMERRLLQEGVRVVGKAAPGPLAPFAIAKKKKKRTPRKQAARS